ncbi:hypothetical protein BGX38DRAFT_1175822 [Terfezia claveryi]|nr:hypothetical protein BGX38DRAFT_1175822 [Terfezia claveryi]
MPSEGESPYLNDTRNRGTWGISFHPDYALALNIPTQKVNPYDEDTQNSWVELESGQIFKGDIVVGANGLRGRAKKKPFFKATISQLAREGARWGGCGRRGARGYSIDILSQGVFAYRGVGGG